MKSEAEIQAEIQIAGPSFGCQLMRNNSGALKDETGRVVRYGLGNVSKQHNDKIKSSDLIGFTVVTVTPDMVGRQLAVFTAVEVKREDWKPSAKDAREAAQNAFVYWVRANGGFAGMINTIEQFRKMLSV